MKIHYLATFLEVNWLYSRSSMKFQPFKILIYDLRVKHAYHKDSSYTVICWLFLILIAESKSCMTLNIVTLVIP